jgi:hypothetical protein
MSIWNFTKYFQLQVTFIQNSKFSCTVKCIVVTAIAELCQFRVAPLYVSQCWGTALAFLLNIVMSYIGSMN